jgi:hypothetical protein
METAVVWPGRYLRNVPQLLRTAGRGALRGRLGDIARSPECRPATMQGGFGTVTSPEFLR